MFADRVVNYSIIFSFLCSFGSIQCSTYKKPATTTRAAGSSSIGRNNTRRIITTRIGETDQQCQCVLFYLCNAPDVVELPSTGQNCGENYICCRFPVDSGGTPLDTTPTNNITSGVLDPYVSEVPIPSSVTPSGTGMSDEECVCVRLNQCMRTLEEQKAGIGIINPRFPRCSQDQICCSPDRVSQSFDNSSPTYTDLPPVDPTPNPFSPSIPPVTFSPVNSSTSVLCGVRNFDVNNRITGTEASKATSFGEFPWMALLFTSSVNQQGVIENVFVCGSSILSSTVVLTAAHCIQNIEARELRVRVGEYDTSTRDNFIESLPHQERSVSRIILHPEFHHAALQNDLALIIVSEPFIFDRHIGPICLPLPNSEFSGQNIYNPNSCVATGWGKNAFNSQEYHTTLKKVDLALVPRDQCERQLRETRLGPFFILDQSFICAGGREGYDTCEGDGGGPLVCALMSEANRYIQVGIVSWGIGCGNATPAAYASLEANSKWLSDEYALATLFTDSPSNRLNNPISNRINVLSNSSTSTSIPSSTTLKKKGIRV